MHDLKAEMAHIAKSRHFQYLQELKAEMHGKSSVLRKVFSSLHCHSLMYCQFYFSYSIYLFFYIVTVDIFIFCLY